MEQAPHTSSLPRVRAMWRRLFVNILLYKRLLLLLVMSLQMFYKELATH
jgi:hypothetical protein